MAALLYRNEERKMDTNEVDFAEQDDVNSNSDSNMNALGTCSLCLETISPFRDSSNPPYLLSCTHVMCFDCTKSYHEKLGFIKCHCNVNDDYNKPIPTGRPRTQLQPVTTFDLEVLYFVFHEKEPVKVLLKNLNMSASAQDIMDAVHAQTNRMPAKYLNIGLHSHGRHFRLRRGTTLESLGFWHGDDNSNPQKQRIIVKDGLLHEDTPEGLARLEKYHFQDKSLPPSEFELTLETKALNQKIIVLRIKVKDTMTFNVLAEKTLEQITSAHDGRSAKEWADVTFHNDLCIIWKASTTLRGARVDHEKRMIFQLKRKPVK